MTEWVGFVGNGPNTLASDVPISLGVEFFVDQPNLYFKGFRFYRGDVGILGLPDARCYKIDGPGVGSAVAGTDAKFEALAGIGWQRKDLALPVGLTQNQHYKGTIFFPTNYTATSGYFVSPGAGFGGIINGPLHIVDSANSQDGQDSFTTGGALIYPTSTFGGGNFWVDVIITDTPGGGGVVGSVADIARQRMLTQLSLVEPQKISNVDLMVLTLAFGGQTVITKTDATPAVHYWRLCKLIANGG